MANAELTVSAGDIATEKEGDPEDASKVPVILQIQPVSERICEDSVEAEAAIEAVEPRQEHGPVQEVEVQYGYPITCGDSKAVLLFEKFVCPGINVKCIKYNDQIISPKQFVHLAGKATLKDWKRAIRIGGVMLRKMMDSGQIDFYQHDTVCTNTCRSTKFDLLISNTRVPPQGSVLTTPTSPQGNGSPPAVVEERPEEAAVTSVEWHPAVSESKKEDEDRKEETLNFWKGIADVGLMGEVVSNIRTELLALLSGVQLRSGHSALQPPDAAVLNGLAQMFGLLDCVKRALHDRRSRTDDSHQLVHSTLAELERQLEEQKKQARDWRSRSAPNFVLMSPGSSTKPPTPKRPRLQRPASTTLLSSSTVQQPNLTAPQFTVLSPISVGSVGQSFNIASLPVASLAQLPAGSQLITRCATTKADRFTLHPSTSLTLLRTTTGPETVQVGTTASNVELVHLTQEVENGEAGVAEGQAGEPDEGTMVEGTLLMQEEVEDEGPAHATVIEIDPAPGDHAVELVGLQLAHEEGGVVLRGEMSVVAEREGEEDEGGAVVQDDLEVVAQSEEGAGVHQENQEQLQDMEIMVIEDEVHDAQVVE
ncbi:glucocorticoid modulatory element-binding protein 1 [Arapaima gigas]